MATPLELIVGQFELQTRLFQNVVSEVEKQSSERLNDSTNHMAWLAGHLVSTRYMLANLLGLEDREPHAVLFEQGKAIDPDADYPDVSVAAQNWTDVSAKLLEILKNLPVDKLQEKSPFQVPTGDRMGQFISFFAHHEAYHIGQLGILRKYFGQEAMKYS